MKTPEFWIGRLAETDRERRTMMVSSGLPGTTILHMKGHVMLYLGDVVGPLIHVL
jgi:hypothetical protein